MPAGPAGTVYEERSYTSTSEYLTSPTHTNNNNHVSQVNGGGGDESAASILQSVKEQEAQFEQLTRELEAERQSVATQLERCKLGSETASMSSISSTDESFHWRQPQPQESNLHNADEESDAESKMSGSQLVDSCLQYENSRYVQHILSSASQRSTHSAVSLTHAYNATSRRVLQERGLMNVGETDPLEYMPDESGAPPPRPPPSSEHYSSVNYAPNHLSNGPGSSHPYNHHHRTDSPNPSIQSGGSRASHRQTVPGHLPAGYHDHPSYTGSASPLPNDTYPSYGGVNHAYHPGSASHLAGPHSPAASSQGRGGTPTRFTHNLTDPVYGEARYSNHRPSDSIDNTYQNPSSRDSMSHHPPTSYTMPQYAPDSHNATDSFNDMYHYREPAYDSYPGPGGEPPSHLAAGPQTYSAGSPYGRPSYDDVNNMDMYRSTPPVDDTYRRLPNGSYSNLSPADRYRNTPPIDGGADPYRDIPPIDDDRFDPNRPPSERGDGYLPRSDGDDQYGDARPDADRYGRHLLDDGRQRQTPSPAPGSDRPGYSYPEDENPYGSRTIPYGQEGPMYSDSGPHNPYDTSGPDMHEPGHMFGREYEDDIQLQGRPPNTEQPPPRSYENLAALNMYNPEDGSPRNIYDEDGRSPYNGDDFGDIDGLQGAPPAFDPRRSPSIDSETRDQRWRNPDLPEVIDFLSHSSNAIKANAAAYLQHLCYMDDGVKAKTRGLNGIPALVELVNNEIPEVHRSACGALRNLSFGRANDENKRAIRNAGGIPALIRLLRKSPDNDVRELVTGILWNLSSCQDIKKQIIDDGLTVIVNNVIVPHSGWDRNLDEEALRQPRDVYWSTVFRNASGILRNISSDGEYARKKLRECEGLVDSIFYIVRGAIGKNDIDNKSVENCVCVLRNLSYACQEVEDPSYLKRRNQPKPAPTKGETTGCFGGNKKKKDAHKIDQRGQMGSTTPGRPRSEPVRGMELLWQPEVVSVYLPLLSDCSNPETLEAAAGAIQNLAACDWTPSGDVRAAVRKERGLPIIVELLIVEADRVVCAAATALRNLALDQRNKELIGKYAMRQLVQKLPQENRAPDFMVSDDTVTAVQATLYEVIKKNADFAQSLLNESGVERLVYITKSRNKYSPKVVKFASSILYTMWQFRELHGEYKNRGWREHHFVTRTMAARGGPSTSANNTLNRPRMDLGGGHPPSSATHSEPSSPGSNQRYGNSIPPHGTYSEPSHTPDSGRYRDDRLRPEDIPMQQMGSAGDMPSPGYAAIDPSRPRDDYRSAGGAPHFSNLPPGGQQPQPQVDSRGEPVYAQVNKQAKRRQDGGVMLDNRQPDGGADSWV